MTWVMARMPKRLLYLINRHPFQFFSQIDPFSPPFYPNHQAVHILISIKRFIFCSNQTIGSKDSNFYFQNNLQKILCQDDTLFSLSSYFKLIQFFPLRFLNLSKQNIDSHWFSLSNLCLTHSRSTFMFI